MVCVDFAILAPMYSHFRIAPGGIRMEVPSPLNCPPSDLENTAYWFPSLSAMTSGTPGSWHC